MAMATALPTAMPTIGPVPSLEWLGAAGFVVVPEYAVDVVVAEDAVDVVVVAVNDLVIVDEDGVGPTVVVVDAQEFHCASVIEK
jgi:hypothetical protein